MKTVLITGAAGFIGSHLVNRLMDDRGRRGSFDCEVIALDKAKDNPNFGRVNADQWIDCDISKADDMKALTFDLSFDRVIHLAAIAAPNVAQAYPDLTFAVNVLGTFNMLKLAKAVGCRRFILASTAHVYGISPKYIPTDETHPIALHDTYTVSKILAEQLCSLFYTNHNLSYCILRLFNGYGPRQSSGYFIPDMIEKAKTGKILLRGANITKDFVYIDDIVNIMVKAMESCYVGPLNVGTGIQTSLGNVASMIAEKFKAELSFAPTEDKGPTHMQSDNTRITSTLNWNPKTTIKDGLALTIKAQHEDV